MSEEQVTIPEDSQLMTIAKGWSGSYKDGPKTIYNRKNNSQVEIRVDRNVLVSLA